MHRHKQILADLEGGTHQHYFGAQVQHENRSLACLVRRWAAWVQYFVYMLPYDLHSDTVHDDYHAGVDGPRRLAVKEKYLTPLPNWNLWGTLTGPQCQEYERVWCCNGYVAAVRGGRLEVLIGARASVRERSGIG